MRSVRMRKTIGNNPQCVTTRSKKQEEGNGNDMFSLIPLDLKIEILEKLPTKSIAKLIFVSEYWSSIIRDKDFTELYLTRSSTRPRLLCIVYGRHTQFFHSFSQEEDQFSDHHQITKNFGYFYEFSPPVRGLICCQKFNRVVISNPSTGQFVTLPIVKTRRPSIISFFGYDPVNDVYKVLCMTVSVVSEEHQVLTLGAENASWRKIKCKHPHRPHRRTKGLCMNGVVYYYASTNVDLVTKYGSLISFDLISEDFNVIKLPGDIRFLEYCNLVNYKGKIAITTESCNGTLDLRVLEDASKQEWSKVLVLVPSWRNLVGRYIFWFRGALSSGELIFAPRSSTDLFYIICYDLKENNARKVVIEGTGDEYLCINVFLDHIESPIFLPKVSSSYDG